MPEVDLKPLEDIFRANVFEMLKEEGKIDDDVIKRSMRQILCVDRIVAGRCTPLDIVLCLWTQMPSRDPPNTASSPENNELVYEFFDDVWPSHDESCMAPN